MQCIFCKGEIKNYVFVDFEVLANTKPMSAQYGAIFYTAALVECPHCDAVFFLKKDSKHLKNMNILLQEELESTAVGSISDIAKMTSKEKRELYEKMKEELIRKYT